MATDPTTIRMDGGLRSRWQSVLAYLREIGTVNSAVQAQIDLKAPLASPTFTGTITTPLTANRAVVTGASGVLAASATTDTEIGYVNGVTSALQTQLGTKAPLASPTFTDDPKAPTPAAADNDTSIPTTAWVQTELKAPTTIGSVTPNTGKFTQLEAGRTFSIVSTAGALTLTGANTGLILVQGSIASNNFCDLVLMQSFGTTVVIASTTFGTPPARTYAQSGADLTIDLDATGNQGTYTGSYMVIR